MTVKIHRTYDLSKVARAKGRNYAEIDGIRIVFEDGKIEGWYDPGPDETETVSTVPSEECPHDRVASLDLDRNQTVRALVVLYFCRMRFAVEPFQILRADGKRNS